MHILRRANAALVILRRAGGTAAVVLVSAGCDGLLNVSNPGSIEEDGLSDPALEQFLINGVVGEFQFAFGNYALWSGILADEAFTDHPNVSFREFSLHDFDDLNAANELIYGALQRARQSADDAADRVRKMQGASAASSLNFARALIYGGYAYVLLGEGFCESPVNLSAALRSDELLARGIARFDEGIAVATAARSGLDATAAQDLIYLAQVGAARASLKKGNPAEARAYATGVPDTYERWAYYSANSVRENNAVLQAVRTTQPWLGMPPAFQGLQDKRVPQPAAPRLSLNSNPIFPPLRPSMYSGWTPTAPSQAIQVADHIRFASGLEARYIVVEAEGPSDAMLTFVNARRAVAGKTEVNVSGSALLTEFRMQRALDFYMTGQRLGDLRRYANAGTDLFPTGKFPVLPADYGTMHCFIVPRSEKSGNPHYRNTALHQRAAPASAHGGASRATEATSSARPRLRGSAGRS
jgi:hypothetical protein